jgi:hypothetical protein
MPAQFNIPVGANRTAGAYVDISKQTPVLTVLQFNGAPDDVIALEQSFDGGVTPQLVGTFTGGAQTLIVEAEANQIRARRLSGSGGAYNIQAAGQNQLGASAEAIIAVGANPGATAGVNISGQPPVLNGTFGGGATADDVANVEHSFDNIGYAPVINVQGGNQGQQFTSGANWARVNRKVGGHAGTLQLWGVPTGKGP